MVDLREGHTYTHTLARALRHAHARTRCSSQQTEPPALFVKLFMERHRKNRSMAITEAELIRMDKLLTGFMAIFNKSWQAACLAYGT